MTKNNDTDNFVQEFMKILHQYYNEAESYLRNGNYESAALLFEWISIHLPDNHFFMQQSLLDGSLGICCFDWKKSVVFGNVKDEKLQDILVKPEYIHIIDNLRYGRTITDVCKRCRNRSF